MRMTRTHRRGIVASVAHRGERGATAVVTLILLVPVLFGAAAISIDVGNLLWERRQLQNGADATVMAAAQKCADAPQSCSPSTTVGGPLDTIDNKNANDGTHSLTSVCANDVARALVTATTPPPLCVTPASGGVTDCPTPVASALSMPWLEVRTHTRTSAGFGSLVNKFARMLVGGGNPQTTVAACSRAGWGPASPTSLMVLPITMSYCDWKGQTGYTGTPGSATYPPGPDDAITPYGYGTGNPWQTSWERKVYTKGNPTTCPTWNGHTAPGGFAQLDQITTCQVQTNLGDWYHGQPGNSTPCPEANFAQSKGKIIYFPVFDCMTSSPVTITPTTDCNSGGGNNTYYHTAGYAAFYLTGWYFSSSSVASIVTGSVPCTGSDRCMSGWFLKDLISNVDMQSLLNPPPGTPNFGLTGAAPLG
jgi:Flp pilus assembly protein TadG